MDILENPIVQNKLIVCTSFIKTNSLKSTRKMKTSTNNLRHQQNTELGFGIQWWIGNVSICKISM